MGKTPPTRVNTADNQPDLLIIYTSQSGRTGAMVEPIRQGMLDGRASTLVRAVEAELVQRLNPAG